MRTILGRLSDLGLRELLKLLNSAGAEGSLEVDSTAGQGRLLYRKGHVCGEIDSAVTCAFATRSGTFCFRPGTVGGAEGLLAPSEWLPQEEYLARLEAGARLEKASGNSAELTADESGDPLNELRESLAEVSLPSTQLSILIITADPRPYRMLTPEWNQRGWEVTQQNEPVWPFGSDPSLLIVHLPGSGALAGQGNSWLDPLREAATHKPRTPVIWIGGGNDPRLRHEAIMAGADFLFQAPASEGGETAKWFREELTSVVERLLGRRTVQVQGEAEAFRDFFIALHADSDPGEARASLLRLASSFFSRGALFAVREEAFECIGSYGFKYGQGLRLSRGLSSFEDCVIERHPILLGGYPDSEVLPIARALGAQGHFQMTEIVPLLAGNDCVAVFLGDERLVEAGSTSGFESLLGRSGAMLVSR